MEVGLRVVRGPDWIWGDQDGGEGGVGTVVDIDLDDDTVVVYWDTGKLEEYRAGCNGKYDLLVFDSAPTGVMHSTVTCDGCLENPLTGTRWKCGVCPNFDLCSNCFMRRIHDDTHVFIHIGKPDGNWSYPCNRFNSVKLKSRGFFPGAKVSRGKDWKWRNQDGGSGHVGRLSEITSWEHLTRAGARVVWDNLKSNVYRTGYRGLVSFTV